MSDMNFDAEAVAKYDQQLQAAFDAEAQHSDCCCDETVNPFCKNHTQKPRKCTECGSWFAGPEHFCYGTYPG